jgi:hypothetical protein
MRRGINELSRNLTCLASVGFRDISEAAFRFDRAAGFSHLDGAVSAGLVSLN